MLQSIASYMPQFKFRKPDLNQFPIVFSFSSKNIALLGKISVGLSKNPGNQMWVLSATLIKLPQ